MRAVAAVTLVLVLGCSSAAAATADAPPPRAGGPGDTHYAALGFFDMHVCYWPERPPFFKLVFSSAEFARLESVRVFFPTGAVLADVDLSRYKTLHPTGKPEKRLYLADVPLPPEAVDGWYYAEIRSRDGAVAVARDFVEIRLLPWAEAGAQPPHGSVLARPPTELRWQPVAGARHYRAFIYDVWDGNKLVFESPLVQEPRAMIPAGILQPDAEYQWRIHARDVHEDFVLGDFGRGSLGPPLSFSVSAPKPP